MPPLQKALRILAEEGPRTAFAKGLRRGKFTFDIAVAVWKLRAEARRRTSLDQSIDFVFEFSAGSVAIAPAQVRSEIRSLLEILAERPPRTILEIGTARGGTLFLLSRAAIPRALLVSIDLPGGDFGGGYGSLWIPLLKALPLRGQALELVRADSHQAATLEQARRLLNGQQLDLILIDGDHRFDGVRQDFLMYGPLVRPGGLIAIHDIVPGPSHAVGGVPDFWNLVKRSYAATELVTDWHQGGYGIGVVRVPGEGFAPAQLILDAPGPDRLGKPETRA